MRSSTTRVFCNVEVDAVPDEFDVAGEDEDMAVLLVVDPVNEEAEDEEAAVDNEDEEEDELVRLDDDAEDEEA